MGNNSGQEQPIALMREQAKLATKLIQESIDATGDLSMVTKLGRKGTKTMVTIYNLRPEQRKWLPASFTSYAWSFAVDGPHKEQVPIRIHY